MAKYARGVSPKIIARERIEILFHLAEQCKSENPDRSARYVAHARDLSMKQRVRLTKTEKRSFCHSCGTYLIPGKTLRVRVAHGRVCRTCTVCGHVVRIPVACHQQQS